MQAWKPPLAAVFVAFFAFSAWTVQQEGLAAVLGLVLAHYWTSQIALDLVLSAGFVMAWIYHDAPRVGRNPWPWLAATVVCGSLAWMVYLLLRPAGTPLFATARDPGA